jgi:predicted nucleic acid-binding protein
MAMGVVLDASAVVAMAIDPQTDRDFREIIEKFDTVYAPSIYYTETANALLKYVKNGDMSIEEAVVLHRDAINLITDFIDDSSLFPEALNEADKLNHPVYDMLYITVCRRNAAALISRDKRLNRLAGRQGVAFLFEYEEGKLNI